MSNSGFAKPGTQQVNLLPIIWLLGSNDRNDFSEEIWDSGEIVGCLDVIPSVYLNLQNQTIFFINRYVSKTGNYE